VALPGDDAPVNPVHPEASARWTAAMSDELPPIEPGPEPDTSTAGESEVPDDGLDAEDAPAIREDDDTDVDEPRL